MQKDIINRECYRLQGIILKAFDIILSFIISTWFINLFGKSYMSAVINFVIPFAVIIVLYFCIVHSTKNYFIIVKKISEIFFTISVVIASYTYINTDNNCNGWISSLCFLISGFICMCIYENKKKLKVFIDKKIKLFDQKYYWDKVFGKNLNEVIFEHEKCVINGRKSRLMSAYEYIISVKSMHTKIYTKRIKYIWLIEALFLYGEVYFYNNISTNFINIYAMLITAILGICSTILWIHTLNGAKYCEENAEKHLAMLEEPIMGNISKVLWIDKHKKQPLSVTNYYICQMFFVLWAFLICIIVYDILSPCICYFTIIFFIFLLIFIHIKYMRSKSISDIKTFKYIS